MLSHRWFVLSALALSVPVGCGARNSLEAASGSATASSTSSSSSTPGSSSGGGAGGSTPDSARIQNDCSPNDGPAILIIVDGSPACPSTIGSGVTIYVFDSDLVTLQAGTTLTVGSAPNAMTQAGRVANGQPMTAISGTVTVSAFEKQQSAAGTYDLAFSDGSTAHGAFTAVWCPGTPTCG
jgi:hypothetical protein